MLLKLLASSTATQSGLLSSTMDVKDSQSSWFTVRLLPQFRRSIERRFFSSVDVCPRPILAFSSLTLTACPFNCSAGSSGGFFVLLCSLLSIIGFAVCFTPPLSDGDFSCQLAWSTAVSASVFRPLLLDFALPLLFLRRRRWSPPLDGREATEAPPGVDSMMGDITCCCCN